MSPRERIRINGPQVVGEVIDGLELVSDDHVLLGDEAIPTVHGIYSSARLHWDDLERLPPFRCCVVNRGDPSRARRCCCSTAPSPTA